METRNTQRLNSHGTSGIKAPAKILYLKIELYQGKLWPALDALDMTRETKSGAQSNSMVAPSLSPQLADLAVGDGTLDLERLANSI